LLQVFGCFILLACALVGFILLMIISNVGSLNLERLGEEYWALLPDKDKNQTQHDTPCCGYRDEFDLPLLPCPILNATSVPGSAGSRALLEGCMAAMVDDMAGFLRPMAYCLFAFAILEMTFLYAAYFIKREWFSPSSAADANNTVVPRPRADTSAARVAVAQIKQLQTQSPRKRASNPSRRSSLSLHMTNFMRAPQEEKSKHHASSIKENYILSAASRQTQRMRAMGDDDETNDEYATRLHSLLQQQKREGEAPKVAKRAQEQEQFEVDSIVARQHKRRLSMMPYWVVHVLYAVVGLWCCLCSLLTVWEISKVTYNTATNWLYSFVIAAFQHLGVSEPLAVLFKHLIVPSLFRLAKDSWLLQFLGYAKAAVKGEEVTWTPFQSESPLDEVRSAAARILQRRWVSKQTKKNFRVLLDRAREQRRQEEELERREKIFASREGFTEEEMDAFRLLFHDFDLDGNGTIDVDELNHALARMGRTVSRASICQMLGAVDLDDSGTINFDEFLYIIAKIRCVSQYVGVINNARFRRADSKGGKSDKVSGQGVTSRDTLSLKHLIEAKMIEDSLKPTTPLQVATMRREEAVTQRKAKHVRNNQVGYNQSVY
jgi:hypothetical protein